METPDSNPKDHVVVRDGRRISENVTADEAARRAEKERQRLQESGGSQGGVEVKQVLNG